MTVSRFNFSIRPLKSLIHQFRDIQINHSKPKQVLIGSILSSFFLITPALAEIKFLDDEQLSSYAGQAGLTIDLSYLPTDTVEFEYNDIGVESLPNLVGGHGQAAGEYYTGQLDNLRINISLGNASDLNGTHESDYGFSSMRELASSYLANNNQLANNTSTSREHYEALAAGRDSLRSGLGVDERRQYENDDLVVHINYLDPFEKDGGYEAYKNGEGLSGKSFDSASIEETQSLIGKAVDFSYSIDEVEMSYGGVASLGFSSASGGDQLRSLFSSSGNASNGTRLMSNFNMQGYLGPHDLHLKEFERDSASGQEVDSTGITWNSYFRVTDLDVYLDIAGIQLTDIQIHNDRGDLSGLNLETQDNSVGNSSFGFAHAQREIYSLDETDFVNPFDKKKKKRKEGIAFNTRFKGDIDIGGLSFGDTDVSIGDFFITDFYFARRLKITARD